MTLCSKKVGKWLHTYQHDFPFVASSQTHQELDHSAKDLMARVHDRVCSEAQEEEKVVANVTEVYLAEKGEYDEGEETVISSGCSLLQDTKILSMLSILRQDMIEDHEALPLQCI